MTDIDRMNTAIEKAVKGIANASASLRLEERRELETVIGELRVDVERLRTEKAALWGLCGGLAAVVARMSPSEPILLEYDEERLRILGHCEPRFYTAPEDIEDDLWSVS